MSPAAASGITVITVAARSAARPPPRRRAMAIVVAAATKLDRIGPKRTPIDDASPLSRMSSAMAGG
jgi:hypothetical protein